jgi:hypothetical protein
MLLKPADLLLNTSGLVAELAAARFDVSATDIGILDPSSIACDSTSEAADEVSRRSGRFDIVESVVHTERFPDIVLHEIIKVLP